ncbi:hypothetical protein ACVMB3_003296 [Sinorhizobium meliloti]
MNRETSSASLQHVTGSVDAKVFEVVEAIFRDLRDRRFLKWIFDERGDACFIANFADGEPLKGLDLEVQGEIKASWQAIISGALTPAPQTHVVPAELCDLTFAIQHNPRCPSRWLVRLVGKSGTIDMKPYGGPFAFMKHETTDRLGFGKTLKEAARAALATDEGQEITSYPEAPEPVGYIGKASLDLMRSGQTAACAMTQVPPKVKEVVALFEHPSPSPNLMGSDSLKNALEMTGCENEEDLIDMANVGNSLMERIDSLVSMPGPYHRWSPADEPAEIVFDLVNSLDELREENTKLLEANVNRPGVEELAAHLCDQFDEDFNPCHGYHWPEHKDDDGYRGSGGYVKLQPSDVQARAREGAERILRFLRLSPSPQSREAGQ